MSVIWKFGWLSTWSPRLEIASSDQVIELMPSSQGGANDPVINSFWTGAKVTPSSTSSLTRDITVLPKSHQKTCREWCHMISPILALLTAGQMVLADGKHGSRTDSNCGSSTRGAAAQVLDWSSPGLATHRTLHITLGTRDTAYLTRNTGHYI